MNKFTFLFRGSDPIFSVFKFELNGLDAERGGGRQERLQVLGAAAGRDRPVEQVAHLRQTNKVRTCSGMRGVMSAPVDVATFTNDVNA